MRAWGLPEEFWVQERVQRSPAEKSWQAALRHPVQAPDISRCAAFREAECPKFHLQAIVDAAHQGAHSPDLQKQGLQKIANIKKCKFYLHNIVYSAAKPPSKSTAKNKRKALHFWNFYSICTTLYRREFHRRNSPLLRVVRILQNFSKYCESFSIQQRFARFCKVFYGVLLQNTYFCSFSYNFSVLAAHVTEWFNVLPRPCFPSCTKVWNAFVWSWWAGIGVFPTPSSPHVTCGVCFGKRRVLLWKAQGTLSNLLKFYV